MVDQLTEIERMPQRRLRVEQSTSNNRNGILNEVYKNLVTLGEKSTALSSTSLFDSRTAASSNTNVTATAASGTVSGSYRYEVFQLATPSQQVGSSDAGAAVTASDTLSSNNYSIPVTAGTITVNDKQITIATSDTLTGVLENIKTAVGGTFVYTVSSDKITLDTGNSGTALVLGSSTDTSNFFSASRLVNNGTQSTTSTQKIGGLSTSSTIGTAKFTAGTASAASSFTINGVTISYTATTTVADMLSNINISQAGVVASYDPVQDRFTLINKNDGDQGISLTESDATGFLTMAKLTTAASGTLNRGQNLLYRVNDGDVLSSSSNTITSNSSGIAGLEVRSTKGSGASKLTSSDASSDIISTTASHGYVTGEMIRIHALGTVPAGLDNSTTYYARALTNNTFTLHTTEDNAKNNAGVVNITGSATGDVYFMGTSSVKSTITVAADNDKIKKAITEFVDQYNKVQSFIEIQSASSTNTDGKVTQSPLANESIVREIASNLRSNTTSEITGQTGTILRLDSLGYETGGYNNQVTLKTSATLDTALRDSIGQVKSLFTTATTGLATRMNAYLTTVSGETGSLVERRSNLSKQATSIDTQIAEMERRVQSNRSMLLRKFNAMEQAQAKSNMQMQFIAQKFG